MLDGKLQNSGCSLICELRVPGHPRLNSALRLSSNHSDRLMILQGQNKISESSVTNFSFGAVKLPLNLRNISLFPILSLARRFATESLLLIICLLTLTEPFWISLPRGFFGSNIYYRNFLVDYILWPEYFLTVPSSLCLIKQQ